MTDDVIISLLKEPIQKIVAIKKYYVLDLLDIKIVNDNLTNDNALRCTISWHLLTPSTRDKFSCVF